MSTRKLQTTALTRGIALTLSLRSAEAPLRTNFQQPLPLLLQVCRLSYLQLALSADGLTLIPVVSASLLARAERRYLLRTYIYYPVRCFLWY